MSSHPTQGFTLVELALVLVIIGLVVGGILVGQELIGHANIRSVARDINQTSAVVRTFQAKYGKLPGDIANATNFWPAGTTCPGTPGTGTCNGNGDDIVIPPSATPTESNFEWQHIALAGLVEGPFNPVWPTGVDLSAAYVPHLKVNDWGKYFKTWNVASATYHDTTNNQLMNRLVLFIGDVRLGAGSHADAMAQTMPCEFAKLLDGKIDDLKPGTGMMHAELFGACLTTTGATGGVAATYRISAPTGITTIAILLE